VGADKNQAMNAASGSTLLNTARRQAERVKIAKRPATWRRERRVLLRRHWGVTAGSGQTGAHLSAGVDGPVSLCVTSNVRKNARGAAVISSPLWGVSHVALRTF
jgi:hypothetical protein